MNPGQLTEVGQGRVEIFAVAETCVLVCPVLEKRIDVAVRSDKPMGPEWDAALVQTLLHLVLRRFEDRRTCQYHLKFSVNPAEPREDTFSYLADKFDRQASSATLRWDTVFSESRGAELAGERRRTGSVADDLDLP